MKICKSCRLEKPSEEFSPSKYYKDGLYSSCTLCIKAKDAAKYQKNREKRLAYAEEYRKAHKEEIRTNYVANVEENRQRSKEYREKNPTKFKESQQKYKEKVKDEANAVRRYLRTLEKSGKTKDELAEAKAEFITAYRADQEFKALQDATSRENSVELRRTIRREKRKRWVEINRGHLNEKGRVYSADKRANDPEWHARELERKTMWRLRNWHNIQEANGWIKYVPSERICLQNFRDLRGWQQGHCYFCNRFMDKDGMFMTVEHILSRYHGGPDLKQNIGLTCSNCNFSRRHKIYHVEWKPQAGILPVTDKFFITSAYVGRKLTNAGIDWSKDEDGNWVLKAVNGRERHFFIVSTFFASDRNPASNGGKVCRMLQQKYDDPLILLDREWYERTGACLNMLRSKMGISDRGPYARKLELVEVSQSDANVFLDEHHVMGTKKNVAIRLGLTDGSTLHAVALFSDKGPNYEWDRLALRGHIAGGMSKLMKGLWTTHGYKPIRSYVDSRYADGGGHETIGFQHLGMTQETYQWVFPDRIQHQRYLSNDNKMSQNLLYFNPELSREDNILANGVFKIWTPKKHIILIEQ